MPLFRSLVGSGAVLPLVADYSAGVYEPRPPVRHHLNKADGRKKVVYTFAAPDELMFKALNLALQSSMEECLSPLCHSFRPRHGPRSAFRSLFMVPDLTRLACLHVDIRDFFNSIPIERLLESLPESIKRDRPLFALLSSTLLDSRVLSDDTIVEDGHKGVMAGTPLAPLLSSVFSRP